MFGSYHYLSLFLSILYDEILVQFDDSDRTVQTNAFYLIHYFISG